MKNKSKLLTLLCVPFLLVGCSKEGENNSGNNGQTNTGDNTGNNNNNGNGDGGNTVITPHTHDWDEENWSSDANQHWHKCKDRTCKEKKDAADHTFGEWVIDSYQETVTVQGNWGQSTTEVRDGTRHRVCSICNYRDVKTDVNYADPNKFNNPTTPYNATYDRDYHIFDKAPEIKFTVVSDPKNSANPLDFATKPNKSKGGGESWEVTGRYSTSNCPDEYVLTDEPGGMKVRGNYTTDYEKKGFRIKFDSKKNLFGLNQGKEFKKWVLFADVKDNAMLRNALSFYLAKRMLSENSKVFVTDFCPVHVYINNQYWGLYLLAEQKEMKSGRILGGQVGDVSGTNIKYTFELDKYATEEAAKPDGDPTFTMTYSPRKNNKENQSENRYNCNGDLETYTMLDDTFTSTQVNYLKGRLEKIYTIMYNVAYNNKFQEINEAGNLVDCAAGTTAEACLDKVLDLDSFVDMYLFNELVVNPDIGYSSFYMSLDMSNSGSKKLMMDNPWDFDSALGVTNKNGPANDAQGLYAANSSNMWFSLIANLDFFKTRAKERWAAYKEAHLFEKGAQLIADYTYSYKGDYARNYDRWPKTMGNNPETNFEVRNELKNYTTQKQASDFLAQWYNNRVTYLDSVFGSNASGQGGNNQGQGQGGNQQQNPPVDYSAFKSSHTKARLEAEAATLAPVGDSGCVVKNKTNEGISGDSYVGNLNPSGGSVTFTYNAAKAGEALLTVGLSQRPQNYKLTDLFDITVNGAAFTSDVNVPGGSGTDFHMWTEIDAGMINLQANTNTIVFTAKQNSTNFDYIDLYLPN